MTGLEKAYAELLNRVPLYRKMAGRVSPHAILLHATVNHPNTLTQILDEQEKQYGILPILGAVASIGPKIFEVGKKVAQAFNKKFKTTLTVKSREAPQPKVALPPPPTPPEQPKPFDIMSILPIVLIAGGIAIVGFLVFRKK